MTTTTTELRAQLATLQGEHDAIWRELTPTAKRGPDGRTRWRDEDLALWMGCDVNAVRSWIVEHVADFLVTDDCRFALLGGRQFVALTLDAKLAAPRLADLDFVDAQIALIASRLTQLGGENIQSPRRSAANPEGSETQ
jgi:hypothetical protein